jgi:hypothetical protein
MHTDNTTQSERPSQRAEREIVAEPPISVSHFVRVLRSYRPTILLSLAIVFLAYLFVAIGTYLFSPAVRVTSQPFRLDFGGAGQGEYPNKTKFNVAEIINGPIVNRAWAENHLADYIPLGEFSRSVFVLESNRVFEQLAAEYQAKFADPKLSPVDRERLQKEFELKAESIAKNEYTVYFAQRASRPVPDLLARKVLRDVLNDWADFAMNQQHVMAYQVSLLSPEVLNPSAIEQKDLIAAIEVLRSKTTRVVSDLQKVERLPGATFARTPNDRLSLEEIRVRLDEIMRFRLEPLLAVVLHTPGLISDRASTIRFLESQLAYDQRQLEAAQRLADSIREAMAVYEQPNAAEATAMNPTRFEPQKNVNGPGEAVMPQLSDTFLDRLMSLTGRAADAQYRQRVVDDYRKAVAETIPLKQAVAYDTQVLNDFRSTSAGAASTNAAAIRGQIDQTRVEVGQLITKMNELFQIVSRNMTPSTQLYTITGPPTTRMLRSVSLQRVALWGMLVLLVALPVIIVFCLLHNRIHEEETADGYVRAEHEPAP